MADGKVVSVLQPAYWPGIASWDLMRKSDVVVLMDDVRFARRECTHRARIADGAGAIRWMEIPIEPVSTKSTIGDVRIAPKQDWVMDHRGLVAWCYRKAPYWGDLVKLFDDAVGLTTQIKERHLSSVMNATIHWPLMAVGQERQIRWSGSFSGKFRGLYPRMVDRVRSVGGSVLLVPAGERRYVPRAMFERARIEIRWHSFNEPRFLANRGKGLSLLHAVAWLGLGWFKDFLERRV